jgi:hypothetical protein
MLRRLLPVRVKRKPSLETIAYMIELFYNRAR